MIQISKVTRVAVAAVLAASAVATFAAPAGAGEPLSGSLTADGSGGVTVEWSGPPESYIVFVLEEGSDCPVGTNFTPFTGQITGLVGAVPGPLAGPTPITIKVGTTVGGPAEETELTAGTYQFCLGELVFVPELQTQGYVSYEELEAELTDPTPPTTAAPSTTSTTEAPAAPAAPAAPRYTG